MSSGENLPPPYEGGCLCGAVRYRFDAPTLGSRICHCRICQRAMAAPFLAHAQFPRASFIWTGETTRYRTSARLFRHFCPTCGTRLFLEPIDTPDRIGVPLTTLDNPQAIKPEMHIWVTAKLDFAVLDDALPKYPQACPEPYREG